MGLAFDEGFSKGQAFYSYGDFGEAIIKKYYPGAEIPEFKEYLNELWRVPYYPSEDQLEYIVFNAALLSYSSAITFIYRADSWLRRSSKFMFRQLHWAVSRVILENYAAVVVGDKGERLYDIFSVDVLLSKSKTMKKKLRNMLRYKKLASTSGTSSSPPQGQPVQAPSSATGSTPLGAQQQRNSGPHQKLASTSAASAPPQGQPVQAPPAATGSTPLGAQQQREPGPHQKLASTSPTSSAPPQGQPAATGSTTLGAQQQTKPGPHQKLASTNATSSAPPQGQPAATGSPLSSGSSHGAQQQRQPSISMGDEVLASQRDLYVHGFDNSMKKDPDVQALTGGDFFTLTDIAEYQRWKLKGSLPALQKLFLKNKMHKILNMRSLFEVDRVGNFWPILPNFKQLLLKVKTGFSFRR